MKKKQSYLDQTATNAKHMKSLRVVRFFRASDLRLGHEGLKKFAEEKGYFPDKLSPGEFFVFVNNAENKIKIMTVNDLLVYMRSPNQARFDLSIVKYIPSFFKGASIDYQGALTASLKERMK